MPKKTRLKSGLKLDGDIESRLIRIQGGDGVSVLHSNVSVAKTEI